MSSINLSIFVTHLLNYKEDNKIDLLLHLFIQDKDEDESEQFKIINENLQQYKSYFKTKYKTETEIKGAIEKIKKIINPFNKLLKIIINIK